MAVRIRQARRCHAHRTNGIACRAYAINGGTVCVAHGGRARQVRVAADRRLAEAQAFRVCALEMARTQVDRKLWQWAREQAAAEVLGLPVERISRWHVLEAQRRDPRPGWDDPPPAPRQDRRYAS